MRATSTLERVKNYSLIVMGVVVSITSTVLLVMILILYPRVDRTVENFERGSESAVAVLENVEQVSSDMAEVSSSLRRAASRVDLAVERVASATENIDQAVGIIKSQFGDLDLATTDLAEKIQQTRSQLNSIVELLGAVRIPEVIGEQLPRQGN